MGIAVASSGALAVVGCAISVVTDQRDTGVFAVLAVLWGVIGGAMTLVFCPPERIRSSTAFVGVLAVWLTLIAVSASTYEILGTFAQWDDSVFESVAGYTTTASTVVRDPETLSRATLLWRAGTQWIGGLGALLFVVAILPSMGVGGLDVTDAGQRHSGTAIRSHRTIASMQRLALLYAALTTTGVALFLAGGMGPFDSITYAATTISTGGFGNHAGSFGHFESVTIEWAGFGGMVLGGANMALIFQMLRRRSVRRLWRSFELRAYLTVVFVGGAVVALTTAPPGGIDHESVRRALFHVASASSTTGHFVGGWSGWEFGPQVLLLAIIGVGAMSGSSGSGFRLVRALALLGYLRRQLVLQLHPRAVVPVRVGRRAVHEAVVARMIGYQAHYLLVAAAGAVCVGALGTEIVAAISASISALANMGPGLGDLAPGGSGVGVLSRPARAVLMPLMLLGRLEIAPVLVGIAIAGRSVRQRLATTAAIARGDDGREP